MTRSARVVLRLVGTAFALLVLPCAAARGQFYGGWMGPPAYGPSGYIGPSYGFPVVTYGYGYAAPTFVNVYPTFNYGYAGIVPYGYPFGSPGLSNPLFGAGMTPLGVQSYLYERNVLGRGYGYASGYAGYSYGPGVFLGPPGR